MRVCRAWFEDGQERRRRGTDASRRTTERQYRSLRQLAFRDRFSSTRLIGDQ